MRLTSEDVQASVGLIYAGIFYFTIEVFILKLPLLVIYMIVAFNITAFTLLLQLDWLIFHSVLAKVIAWGFTVGSWVLAYVKRDKYITLF